MDVQQSQKMKAIDDQQAEEAGGKLPYKTSMLRKLGSVEQLTQGTFFQPGPDDTVFSL